MRRGHCQRDSAACAGCLSHPINVTSSACNRPEATLIKVRFGVVREQPARRAGCAQRRRPSSIRVCSSWSLPRRRVRAGPELCECRIRLAASASRSSGAACEVWQALAMLACKTARLTSQRLRQALRKHHHPVLAAFTLAHDQCLMREVNVLHPQLQGLADPHAGALQQPCQQGMLSLYPRQDAHHLVLTQHHWQATTNRWTWPAVARRQARSERPRPRPHTDC